MLQRVLRQSWNVLRVQTKLRSTKHLATSYCQNTASRSLATRWFSSEDDSEVDSEQNDEVTDEKTSKVDEQTVWEDDGDLTQWIDEDEDEEDIMASDYANETLSDLYDMYFEGGRDGPDYVPLTEFRDAIEMFPHLDDRQIIDPLLKVEHEDEEAGEEFTPMIPRRSMDAPMNDPERGVVEARSKYRKGKGKALAYEEWKDHLFGFQSEQYTAADQLVIHNSPALTVHHSIGVRPTPIWETLREKQEYPEDDQQGDNDADDDMSAIAMNNPDLVTGLTPEMQEQMALIDRQFEDLSGNFLDEQEAPDDAMSMKALMRDMDKAFNEDEDADAIEQEVEQKPFFKIENAPEEISEDLERSFRLESSSEQESIDMLLSRAGFVIHHIASNRVSNMTAKGKVHSIRVLIVMGNQHGTAGYATSRADTEEIAVDLACKKAVKNLMFIDLYKGDSLHEPLRGRFHSTHALLWPGHPDGGLRVGYTMWAICDCFGIKNMSGKVIGRNNPHAVIPAIFSALIKYRPIEDVALGRGRRLYDIRNVAPRYMMGF